MEPWEAASAAALSAPPSRAVVIGVLAWGWLWGLPGLLLGVPILMFVKVVCDHVEDLSPIGGS